MPSDVSLMAKKFYFFDCLLDGVRFKAFSAARIFNVINITIQQHSCLILNVKAMAVI